MGRTHNEASSSLAKRAEGSRAWAARQIREHPLGTGLGLLTLGFVSAALIPSFRSERRAVARASDTAKDLADRLELARHLEETVQHAREVAALQLAAALEHSASDRDVESDEDLEEDEDFEEDQDFDEESDEDFEEDLESEESEPPRRQQRSSRQRH